VANAREKAGGSRRSGNATFYLAMEIQMDGFGSQYCKLLSVGRLYEIEARLIDRARQCIVGSKELIIGADVLLSAWLSRLHAYDPKAPRRAQSQATVAPIPSTSSEASHR